MASVAESVHYQSVTAIVSRRRGMGIGVYPAPSFGFAPLSVAPR